MQFDVFPNPSPRMRDVYPLVMDIQSNLLITEIIHHLKSMGKTLIISSHIFSTLRDTCDEIHLLEKGKITRAFLPAQYDQLESDMRQTAISGRLGVIG